MKVFEVLSEDDTQARLQSIGQKIRQAQATGDAAAVMQAGAEMEPILKNEIMPGMYRVLDQFIRGMEEALRKDPNHPDAERVRQELPKLKAELEQSKRDSMQAGMANLGRQDVGEEMPNAADQPRDPRVIRNMPNAGGRPRDPRVIRNMPNAAADDVNPVEAYINALKDPNADPEWVETLRKIAAAFAGMDPSDATNEGILDWFKSVDNPVDQQDDVVPMVKQLLDQGMSHDQVIAQVEEELGVRPRYIRSAIAAVEAGLAEGRLKSRSYRKSYKAAKASGRRRKKSLRDSVAETATSGATSVGGGAIATVSNPSVTRNAKKPKKRKGVAPNAQDSNANLMTGQLIKR